MELKYVLQYIRTVLNHKKYVFKFMTICGFPIRGLLHDMSKFSYTEFKFNVKYMNGTGESPIDVAKRATGGYSLAWLHHKRNSHHYEYWMDNFDKGAYATRMEFSSIVEMMCDMLAANIAYSKDKNKIPFKSTYEYWKNCKYGRIAMHPDSQKFLDDIFKRMSECEKYNQLYLIYSSILNKEYLKRHYDWIEKNSKNPKQVKLQDIISKEYYN